MERRKHWEKVYRERSPETVSWYQALPAISLRLIEKPTLRKQIQLSMWVAVPLSWSTTCSTADLKISLSWTFPPLPH